MLARRLALLMRRIVAAEPAATTHRYWRILVTDSLHATNVDVREIELREEVGGADVTGTGTASATAFAGGFEASKAFDNDMGTTWYFNRSTNPLPQSIKYDFGLGAEKNIQQFALTAYSAPEMISAFALQYSDDDSAWTTKFSTTDAVWADSQTKLYATP